jgi:uncharacterized protein
MTRATSRTTGRVPDPEVLAEVIRRIVEVAQPERIILFGSAARGEMGPDSDIDLLVVKAGVEHRRRLAQRISRRLFGVTTPVDLVVVTPEDLDRHAHSIGPIIAPALAEGRTVYAAA